MGARKNTREIDWNKVCLKIVRGQIINERKRKMVQVAAFLGGIALAAIIGFLATEGMNFLRNILGFKGF